MTADLDAPPPPHRAAGHQLPHSNGWGSHGRTGQPPVVSVWCGRCGGSYAPDRQWALRWLASVKRRIEAQTRASNAAYRITPEQAAEAIESWRAELVKVGLL